jgi:hypothetical protein
MKSVICSSSVAPVGAASRSEARAGQVARAGDAEVADVRALAHALVAAARLAQRGVRAGDVEDVVNDLKEDAELGGEASPGGRLGLVHAGQEEYADHRGADQAPRLQGVQTAQLLGRVPHSGHVQVLPADHPVHSGGRGQLAGGGQHERGLADLLAEEVAEGLGIEAVAGEDGDVLAVLHVARGPSAAQVVVVHGRQVVVDERVGVDELDGRGQGEHAGRVAADGPLGGQRQHGPDALAAGQQRVAHRLLQPSRLRRGAGEAQVGEVALDRVAQGLRVGAHLQQGVLARDGLLLRGAGHALELRRGLGGHAGRVLDQAGGGVGREVAGAQLLGRALQARDEGIEGGGVDLGHR